MREKLPAVGGRTENMVSGEVKVTIAMGLHLRPAGILCKQATQYQCRIELDTGRAVVNAKSVLSVLGACVRSGDEVRLICDGPDEQQAFDRLEDLVENKLESKLGNTASKGDTLRV